MSHDGPGAAPVDAGTQVAAATDGGGSRATSAAGPAGRDLVAVLGTSLLLGVVAAVLWWLLVDPAEFTRTAAGGLGMGEVELGKRFNDDGWFVVISGVLGLLSGAGFTWWRSRDPLLTSVLVVLGAALGVATMALLGRWLGPSAPASVADAAATGASLPVPLEVTGAVCYLVWPITALLGALLVLWSPGPGQTGSGASRTEDTASG
ncbi:hypothetical protein [Nocardioides mesophilus]|uniref:DUF2567 domain-containing protein n=1 Tax=Nocardioides mesophilus TaxID=433659 RepID=A0A7G9RBV0_9ACTN|nr:hypothetical protein [Nocardioides mesophilus]QNN53075.1 hypothetical protein H9L09_00800 [Nocardioides mesophilus]